MNRSFFFFAMVACPNLLEAQQKPNVIVILTDDQGYQDLGCYGSPLIKTPEIDKMACDGLKLTDFYASSSISSPSRAGLLTGKFNTRNGVRYVLFPEAKGMPTTEITLAEALKEEGYATGCFGKWHLGDLKGHLPVDQGFDEYFGIPYSNDMYIAPSQEFDPNVVFNEGYHLAQAKSDQLFVKNARNSNEVKEKLGGKCPLFKNDKIIEYPCDLATTTYRYFDCAIDFIHRNQKQPFFVYLTPAMPHVPLHASNQFKGKSKRGLYGDVVEEIDWNVGRLLKYLEQNNLSENTLIIYTSDNGPWLTCKEDGGCADPLRDGKFSYYEGGVRVPCIIRWKGVIPAGVTSDAIISSIDIFPTVMRYAGCNKINHKIDGIDVSAFLENPSLRIRDEYVYVKYGKISGVRKGEWVYLPETGRKKMLEGDSPELFNLKQDVRQTTNLYFECPNKISELKEVMEKHLDTIKAHEKVSDYKN